MNNGASWLEPLVAQARVLGIQRKLNKWAQDDQDRRFTDLHNLVCDPVTLQVALASGQSGSGYACAVIAEAVASIRVSALARASGPHFAGLNTVLLDPSPAPPEELRVRPWRLHRS